MAVRVPHHDDGMSIHPINHFSLPTSSTFSISYHDNMLECTSDRKTKFQWLWHHQYTSGTHRNNPFLQGETFPACIVGAAAAVAVRLATVHSSNRQPNRQSHMAVSFISYFFTFTQPLVPRYTLLPAHIQIEKCKWQFDLSFFEPFLRSSNARWNDYGTILQFKL